MVLSGNSPHPSPAKLPTTKPLDSLFSPSSIAVIGVSRNEKSLGHVILKNLFNSNYQGILYPVNPKTNVVACMKCYISVLAIPDPVELAIIVVPRKLVAGVIEECGRKGVKGIVCITAGFREVGGEGIGLEKEIVTLVRRYNMRMIGPNCMGILNTDPLIRMDATFAPNAPLPGNIAFMSQSGALGAAILAQAKNLHIGFSEFASIGNKADVAGDTILERWQHDPRTDLILLYLESFGDPRRFTKLARQITKHKPIIVVKSGSSLAGAVAAASHTGALASSDVITEALFEQIGVLRVKNVEHLFDFAQVFACGLIPQGNRVVILTNAGGPGILAADALGACQLPLAKLSAETLAGLRRVNVPEACVTNPIDMVAGAGGEQYHQSLALVLKDPGVDIVLTIFVPPTVINEDEVVQGIIAAKKVAPHKPVLTCVMGRQDEAQWLTDLRSDHIPVYLYPESAVNAIHALVRYAEMRNRAVGKMVTFKDVNQKQARLVIETAIKRQQEWLSASEVMAVFTAYGIPFVPMYSAHSLEEVLQIAADKYPVVLKVASLEIIHKSDVHGVELDLRNSEEVVVAYQKIQKSLTERGIEDRSVKLQPMLKGGQEVLFGMTSDPNFGAVIAFGLGGLLVEMLKDVKFYIHPITDVEAKELIASINGYELLNGYRGMAKANVGLLEEIALRLSQLIHDFPAIKSFDINPFLVFPAGQASYAVDGRIQLHV